MRGYFFRFVWKSWRKINVILFLNLNSPNLHKYFRDEANGRGKLSIRDCWRQKSFAIV